MAVQQRPGAVTTVKEVRSLSLAQAVLRFSLHPFLYPAPRCILSIQPSVCLVQRKENLAKSGKDEIGGQAGGRFLLR